MRSNREMSPTVDIIGGALGVIAGGWLLISPFVLNYSNMGKVTLMVHGAPVVQDASSAPIITFIGGAILLALALFTLATARMPQFSLYRLYANVAMVVIGIVLMVQPYFSEYDGVRTPLYNLQICGALIIIFAGFVTQALYKRSHATQ